jgi:cathepsin B
MSKVVALLFAAVAVSALPEIAHPTGSALINDLEHIAYLNSVNSTWTAGVNERFEGLSYDSARQLLGTQLSHISEHMDEVQDQSVYDAMTAVIPDSFDATQQWGDKIHPIRDQQRCGSCWAFSAAEVMSDRFSIASNSSTPVLSPEDLVQCDTGDQGCQGGRLPSAWSYIKNTGLVTDSCDPYTSGSGTRGTCTKKCADGKSWTPYKAKTAFAIDSVENMQKEIMTNGPIQVAFMVYKSFMSYKTGVYQKHWYEFIPEGGHAVKIVGWGTESGTDYWLVANSWNTSWGEKGFFKILRGKNQCGIEKNGPPYAGTPAL